jgi:hypothetical protein
MAAAVFALAMLSAALIPSLFTKLKGIKIRPILKGIGKGAGSMIGLSFIPCVADATMRGLSLPDAILLCHQYAGESTISWEGGALAIVTSPLVIALMLGCSIMAFFYHSLWMLQMDRCNAAHDHMLAVNACNMAHSGCGGINYTSLPKCNAQVGVDPRQTVYNDCMSPYTSWWRPLWRHAVSPLPPMQEDEPIPGYDGGVL